VALKSVKVANASDTACSSACMSHLTPCGRMVLRDASAGSWAINLRSPFGGECAGGRRSWNWPIGCAR
jgi:hypothetical protein